MTKLSLALVGNPNCGKTALFNRLTGARQKVANYAGVTVERKEGQFYTPKGRLIDLVDLPGAYSLEALTPDERVTYDVLTGKIDGISPPDAIICVADATNLTLHMRFILEVRALNKPMVIALNMMDAAKDRGLEIDVAGLSEALGVDIIETVAIHKNGVEKLSARFDSSIEQRPDHTPFALSSDEIDAEAESLLQKFVKTPKGVRNRDDALDRIFLHPILGLGILCIILFVVFQAVYAWATPMMDLIEIGISKLGEAVTTPLPEGLLRDFIAQALFGGLGSVLVFLPQILILFFFILLLEESGYLPRAAFLLDSLMAGVGLSGRSFIPLLSSFACAIPGIMATRAIPNDKDRIVTILIAPLMTCSARLPVYTLLIGAFVPAVMVGPFQLQGLVLFSLYFLAIISAYGVAKILSLFGSLKTHASLMMELPTYRLARIQDILHGLWERAFMFLSRITGIIFAANTLLWVMATFPRAPIGATRPAIDYSFAGQVGHALEPLFAPIGFGWQICVALIPGLAAREVAVSALGTVYAISGSDDTIAQGLSPIIASQWSIATALSLLAWYVFAPQCLSTLAVMRRETNSWKWVVVATTYLFGLAYVASFITYQTAKGFGL